MRRLVVIAGIAMLALIGASTARAQGADIFGVGGGHVIDNKPPTSPGGLAALQHAGERATARCPAQSD